MQENIIIITIIFGIVIIIIIKCFCTDNTIQEMVQASCYTGGENWLLLWAQPWWLMLATTNTSTA